MCCSVGLGGVVVVIERELMVGEGVGDGGIHWQE